MKNLLYSNKFDSVESLNSKDLKSFFQFASDADLLSLDVRNNVRLLTVHQYDVKRPSKIKKLGEKLGALVFEKDQNMWFLQLPLNLVASDVDSLVSKLKELDPWFDESDINVWK